MKNTKNEPNKENNEEQPIEEIIFKVHKAMKQRDYERKAFVYHPISEWDLATYRW